MKHLLFLLLIVSEIALCKEPVLIGGKVAKPGEFEEVVYISSGRSRCSAAIVGERVLLTAAHCIEDGGDIFPADFIVKQQVFNAKCMHHPKYSSHYSYDFALCKTKEPMNVEPATISREPVEVDELAVLMGYGCTQPRNPDGSQDPGGNDGKLRWGKAIVTQVDDGVNGVGGGQYFFTNDNTALCFGDSGGPSMKYIEKPKKERHLIVGVNSRGDIRKRSLLSATYLDGFQNWAKAYALSQNVKICGINKDCFGDSEPEPEPDPDDEFECIEERYNVWKYTNLLNEWKSKLQLCKAGIVLL